MQRVKFNDVKIVDDVVHYIPLRWNGSCFRRWKKMYNKEAPLRRTRWPSKEQPLMRTKHTVVEQPLKRTKRALPSISWVLESPDGDTVDVVQEYRHIREQHSALSTISVKWVKDTFDKRFTLIE